MMPKPRKTAPESAWYRFVWERPGLPGRKGQRCQVLARGKLNSCWIQFEDGYQAVVSRNALRRWKPAGNKPCGVAH
jgi:hypothetical protein